MTTSLLHTGSGCNKAALSSLVDRACGPASAQRPARHPSRSPEFVSRRIPVRNRAAGAARAAATNALRSAVMVLDHHRRAPTLEHVRRSPAIDAFDTVRRYAHSRIDPSPACTSGPFSLFTNAPCEHASSALEGGPRTCEAASTPLRQARSRVRSRFRRCHTPAAHRPPMR